MIVLWKEEFREDLKRLEKRLKNPQPFRKALYRAITELQKGKDLSGLFPVNRITARGAGWYDCYLYDEIVMFYRIQGQRVILTAIGFPNEFLDR